MRAIISHLSLQFSEPDPMRKQIAVYKLNQMNYFQTFHAFCERGLLKIQTTLLKLNFRDYFILEFGLFRDWPFETADCLIETESK